jgi:formylglycine-generating enzyme required for sulfatase activity
MLSNYAWSNQNNAGKTQAVGQKSPNPFGLFDMHGNVWEWVEDCWHENYVGAPTDGSAWATGCNVNSRVLRGGSWVNSAADLRASFRDRGNRFARNNFTGFRLARDWSGGDVQSKAAPSAIEGAKQKCGELGFGAGTEAYGRCVLKLSK